MTGQASANEENNDRNCFKCQEGERKTIRLCALLSILMLASGMVAGMLLMETRNQRKSTSQSIPDVPAEPALVRSAAPSASPSNESSSFLDPGSSPPSTVSPSSIPTTSSILNCDELHKTSFQRCLYVAVEFAQAPACMDCVYQRFVAVSRRNNCDVWDNEFCGPVIRECPCIVDCLHFYTEYLNQCVFLAEGIPACLNCEEHVP